MSILSKEGRLTIKPGNITLRERDEGKALLTNISSQHFLAAGNDDREDFYTDSWCMFRKRAKRVSNIPALLKFYTKSSVEIDAIIYITPGRGPWNAHTVTCLMQLTGHVVVKEYKIPEACAVATAWSPKNNSTGEGKWPTIIIVSPDQSLLSEKANWTLDYYCSRVDAKVGTDLSMLYAGMRWVAPPAELYYSLKRSDPIVAWVLANGASPYTFVGDHSTLKGEFKTLSDVMAFVQMMGYDTLEFEEGSLVHDDKSTGQVIGVSTLDIELTQMNDSAINISTGCYALLKKSANTSVLAPRIVEVLMKGLMKSV